MSEFQIFDKPCRTCGTQPATYERTGAHYRRTCVECVAKAKAGWWQRRATESKGKPPYKLIDRACTKCKKDGPLWFGAHPSAKDGYRRDCVDCVRDYQAAYRQRPKAREALVAYQRDHAKDERQALKIEVLTHYGGFCFCCGEGDWRFLTLDHSQNDGAKHRKTVRALGTTMYRWARKRNFPPIFQVACFNCNCARQFRSDGTCPHEDERARLLAA